MQSVDRDILDPVGPDTEVALDLTVRGREAIADGVIMLALTQHDPTRFLPAWTPGAHIDLELAPGLTRQYSLCGDPRDRDVWHVAVLREEAGRGGSDFVHTKLHPGQLVRARGPRNHFQLAPADRYIFIAGGIGITPILPMIAAAEAAGIDWELHYGGRTRSSMAFLRFLATRAGSRIHVHPQDEVGLIDLDKILDAPRDGELVYCCGPGPLLDAVEAKCTPWPSDALRVERFAPKPQSGPVAETSFEVELAQSGRILNVAPTQSVLEVVRSTGVDVLSSCEEGTCGTCETAVLCGQIDHRDSLLTPDEQSANDTMFICVSRSLSPRLVIDR